MLPGFHKCDLEQFLAAFQGQPTLLHLGIEGWQFYVLRPRMSLLLVMDVDISPLSCHPCVWWSPQKNIIEMLDQTTLLRSVGGYSTIVSCFVQVGRRLKLLKCKWHNLRPQVSVFGLANHHQRTRNGSAMQLAKRAAVLMMQKGSLKWSDRLTSNQD